MFRAAARASTAQRREERSRGGNSNPLGRSSAQFLRECPQSLQGARYRRRSKANGARTVTSRLATAARGLAATGSPCPKRHAWRRLADCHSGAARGGPRDRTREGWMARPRRAPAALRPPHRSTSATKPRAVATAAPNCSSSRHAKHTAVMPVSPTDRCAASLRRHPRTS